MAICTFFGHRFTPVEVILELRSEIIRLINEENVDTFYVGNNGDFDHMAHQLLKKLSNRCDFKYSVVLAYMPEPKRYPKEYTPDDTILPEGIERVPKRAAIPWRNKWMINRSDFVITYVTHSVSGAAEFKGLAEKMGKAVVNLADRPIL